VLGESCTRVLRLIPAKEYLAFLDDGVLAEDLKDLAEDSKEAMCEATEVLKSLGFDNPFVKHALDRAEV
jgi:hypothetical protein